MGDFIEIKGARVNNLKNVSVKIPRNKLIVVTGVSGSGKSSLAFDTIYAEGQRRYIESLSSYARQFLGKIEKPEVDNISGIPPAVAVEQKVISKNSRSTVGTTTEIYDYLRTLFARIGRTYSPITGEEIKKHSIEDVTSFIKSNEEGIPIYIAFKHKVYGNIKSYVNSLMTNGFNRIIVDNKIEKLGDIDVEKLDKELILIVDRLKVRNNLEFDQRINSSIEKAFSEGGGRCIIYIESDGFSWREFSEFFEEDGIVFEEPTINLFSFNNPIGACPICEGYGKVLGVDEKLVIPDPSLSVYEGAIACFRGDKLAEWNNLLISQSDKLDIPIHRPYSNLSNEQKRIIWYGKAKWPGIYSFFSKLEEKLYKIQNRVLISRYRGQTTCAECGGTRLKREASYVKICGKSLPDLVDLPLDELLIYFKNISLSNNESLIAERLLNEIKYRIGLLIDIGLSYLTLNRTSNSLSGGESQRINLITSIGSSLVGALYVLDEPSIGLHSRDTKRLISVLKRLRDNGNTVLVVEHDEEIIRSADYLIDIGPGAGSLGGEILFSDEIKNIFKADTYTARYLNGELKIEVPEIRKEAKGFVRIRGAMEHNLKNIDIDFPLGVITVITGVSGSGKSTLVGNILYPSLKRYFGESVGETGIFKSLDGDLTKLSGVEFVDQNPIGKSSRSNPVTYIKAWDDIRKLYSDLKLAKISNMKPSHFSFNVPGGRCEECQGAGEITVEMQFMADVNLVCESCHGKRFKDEVLEITYKQKNVSDILDMTVNEAIDFFSAENAISKRIVSKLKPLQDVGLGYVKLGQSSSTLSGGESQRVKLASFLTKGISEGKKIFIFDEPTTGLHFHDIDKLLRSFGELIHLGHTIIIVEHNYEVIKSADYLIELGPEGGKRGGEIVFAGKPEELVKKDTNTAKILLKYLQ